MSGLVDDTFTDELASHINGDIFVNTDFNVHMRSPSALHKERPKTNFDLKFILDRAGAETSNKSFFGVADVNNNDDTDVNGSPMLSSVSNN